MALLPQGPKPCASANSATPASLSSANSKPASKQMLLLGMSKLISNPWTLAPQVENRGFSPMALVLQAKSSIYAVTPFLPK